jgi:hypothetical protein
MEKNAQWKRRTGGVVSTLYLLIFVLFELYSASATDLDRNPAFPTREHLLGWALFALPCGLLVSLFLYASFMIFELTASDGIPASHRAMWELEGIWATLFLAAFLAARFLQTKAETMDSRVPGKSL